MAETVGIFPRPRGKGEASPLGEVDLRRRRKDGVGSIRSHLVCAPRSRLTTKGEANGRLIAAPTVCKNVS